MRTIKFRGIGRGKWIYFNLFQDPDIAMEQQTIGQYTDLKDKNGKEIYEGDIVKATHFILGEWIAKVDIQPTGVWFGGSLFSDMTTNSIEIIGNIYQNSDLLSQDNQQNV